MLHFITDITDKFLAYIKDDPVRPDLPTEFRVSDGRMVLMLGENEPEALVCVSFHEDIPADVAGLDNTSDTPTSVIFYTVWSYQRGAGRDLLFQSIDAIRESYPTVTRFLTLSPRTEMARQFHMKNGAVVFRENETSTNFEYHVSPGKV